MLRDRGATFAIARRALELPLLTTDDAPTATAFAQNVARLLGVPLHDLA